MRRLPCSDSEKSDWVVLDQEILIFKHILTQNTKQKQPKHLVKHIASNNSKICSKTHNQPENYNSFLSHIYHLRQV